jgi:hypothetical protein
MKLYKWFSICSRHREYSEGCELCEVGSWVFMPTHYIGHIIFKFFPSVWRYWANRPKRRLKWLNQFTDRKTEKKVNPFPNLR